METRLRNHETDVWLEGIRAPFEHELDAVRERLAEMAGSVDSMLEASVLALMKHDATPVERVFAEDDTVDELDSSIETDCLRLIALRRPVGRDLRFLGAAIKMVTDLERIGDHAVDVAR